MDRSQIIKFREVLKDKFDREEHNREYFLCSIEEAKNFIISYCTLIEWNSLCVLKNGLANYSNSL